FDATGSCHHLRNRQSPVIRTWRQVKGFVTVYSMKSRMTNGQSADSYHHCLRPATIQSASLAVIFCLAMFTLAGCSRDPKAAAEKPYAKAEKYLKDNKADAAIIE